MARSGYDNGDAFIKALSSFWTTVYQDRALLTKFTSGYGELFSDAYFNFLESILSTSIEDVPVFNRKKWYFLAFKESENLADAKLIYTKDGISYGPQPEGAVFSPGNTFQYGGNFNSDTLFRWVLPREIVDVDRFLMNRIHSPSLVMTKGQEFIIEEFEGQKVITFASNPFEDPRIPVREIKLQTGGVQDREFGLWALNTHWDYELVWENYGKLVGFYRENSEEYKTFVSAIWDLFVGGPNFKNVEAGINAVLGLPIARDTEVIREIIDDGTNNNIVTDLNIYTIDNSIPLRSDFFSATGSLIPGIQLTSFEPLTDVVIIKDSVSDPQWWRDVNPMIIPKNLIYENVDFFLPDNIVVYADMVIGREWGIPATETAPNEYLETLGLRIGEWQIGDDGPGVPLSFKFDYKDYIMENFFKENLFFLSISPSVTQLQNFQRQVVKIIFDAIPSYTTFINYTFLDTITDDYEAEANLTGASFAPGGASEIGFDGVERIKGHNNESQVLDVGTGIPLTEDAFDDSTAGYDSSLNAGYQDGYQGFPFIGYMVIGGFTVGTVGFQEGLLVRSICGN